MVDISNPLWSQLDSANTADSPNGYNSTTTPANVIAIQQAAMGAIKRQYERSGPVLTTTGASPNYIVTPTNSAYPSALVQGDIYCFIASFTNSGSATLNYNNLGAIPLRKPSTSGLLPLSGNEIISGQTVIVAYNGATFQIVSLLPASSTAAGTVTSVGMTGDNVIYNTSVSGSPVTTVGTLTPSLKTQSANKVLVGPSSGAAAIPTFRSLGLTDLPAQTGTGNIVLATAPTLTNPVVGTQSQNDNSTKAASTAYADRASVVRLLDTQGPTSAAAVTFTSIPATYSFYEMRIYNLTCATAGDDLLLEYSSNNGVSWINTAASYAWSHNLTNAGGNTPAGSNSDTAINLVQGVGNNTSPGVNGIIRLYGLGAGLFKAVNYDLATIDTSNTNYGRIVGNGALLSTAIINGVRLRFSTGNTGALTPVVKLYGWS